MKSLIFDNAFVRDLPGDPREGPDRRQVHGAFYSRIHPTPVTNPVVMAWSREMLGQLGWDETVIDDPEFAQVFSGNRSLDGMSPYSANYGGHQFGNWAGQLGDGRAITLGEVLTDHQRLELQLKGAGPTPYSRTADGRAVLRSSIREFLCSEAMHHLGIPTTRALCLIGTGESVVRDMFYDGNPAREPGAIVCRVAPSFIRFGNFELPASRGETQLVKQLADFTIRRDFPELKAPATGPLDQSLYAEWFAQVCERTAVMIAHWQRVGFVHGVMNTDNMSILGLTLDYGPYGWIDNFDLSWTPNTTDAGQRRYRFGNQPQIGYWNLGRLAGALLSLFETQEPLHAGMDRYVRVFQSTDKNNSAAKLGLTAFTDADEHLHQSLQELLQAGEMDMTLFYRALADWDLSQAPSARWDAVYYDQAKREATEAQRQDWLLRYSNRIKELGLHNEDRIRIMNRANPLYVCRNYLAQEAIDQAHQGDVRPISNLLEVLRTPYTHNPQYEAYAQRRPDWARNKAGCSMLSCSS